MKTFKHKILMSLVVLIHFNSSFAAKTNNLKINRKTASTSNNEIEQKVRTYFDCVKSANNQDKKQIYTHQQKCIHEHFDENVLKEEKDELALKLSTKDITFGEIQSCSNSVNEKFYFFSQQTGQKICAHSYLHGEEKDMMIIINESTKSIINLRIAN